MSQIENNLTKDEIIVAKAEINTICLIETIVRTVLCGIIIGLLLLPIVRSMLMYRFNTFFAIITVLTPTILISGIYTFKDMFVIKTTELAVTNKKIFGKTGFINTKIMDAPLNKVNNITVEQNLSGKIFGFGKVVITTSSGNYNYLFVKNADDFRRIVMNQIDTYNNETIKKQAEELAHSMTSNNS